MSNTDKEIKEGAYKPKALEVEELPTRRAKIPYDEIVETVKAGNIYVLSKTATKYSMQKIKKKLKDAGIKDIKVGKTKDTKQYAFYTV